MSRQHFDNLWASGGVKESPEVSIPGQVAAGWVDEVPPYSWQNWWQNRADQSLEQIERRGIQIWDAATLYFNGGLAVGSDLVVYQATSATISENPLLFPAAWIPLVRPMLETIITADDPAWVPALGAKKLRVIATGGGGGAGGVADSVNERSSGGGGGGATAIKTYLAPLSANYAILFGAGGTGGIGGAAGGSGNDSRFDGSLVGAGGGGGQPGPTDANYALIRANGGTAIGGDLNMNGTDGSNAIGSSGKVTMLSTSGGSYWGGGIGSNLSGGSGVDATGIGIGLGGGGLFRAISGTQDGGDGSDGVVVIQAFF